MRLRVHFLRRQTAAIARAESFIAMKSSSTWTKDASACKRSSMLHLQSLHLLQLSCLQARSPESGGCHGRATCACGFHASAAFLPACLPAWGVGAGVGVGVGAGVGVGVGVGMGAGAGADAGAGVCVCVCVGNLSLKRYSSFSFEGALFRLLNLFQQGGKGSSDKPCPTKPVTGVDAVADHHCVPGHHL